MFSCCFKKCQESDPQESQGDYPVLVWEQGVTFRPRRQSLERVSQSSRASLNSTGRDENELVLNVDELSWIETLEDKGEEEPMNQLMLVFFGQDQCMTVSCDLNQLIPAFFVLNPDWGSPFRSISSGFITTQQVLELLFPSTMPSIVGTWTHQSSQVFYQPAAFHQHPAFDQPLSVFILQLLLPYLQPHMGSLNVEGQAQHVLAQLEDGKADEAENECEEARELELSGEAAPVPSEVAAPSPGPQLKLNFSEVSPGSSSQPQYNKRVGDSCSIHVHLENERTEYKIIVVTCQDRARTVIRRALDEHLLYEEDPKDFKLLQIVSKRKKLRIPDDGNVFYAINPHVDFDFLLKKKRSRKGAKVKRKEVSESTSMASATVSNISPALSSISPEKARPKPMATKGKKKSSLMRCIFGRSSGPQYNKQVGESCLIHVRLEQQSKKDYETVLVTCNDRAPVVIRRALEQLLPQEENPEDYELGQIISQQQRLRIPQDANVFYGMNPRFKYDFVLRKRTHPNEEDVDWIDPKPPTYEATEAHHWNLLSRICCCLSGQG